MKKRILVIDDDAYLGEQMREFLEEQGYSTRFAADGPKGLEMIEKFRPHLVLLDVIMPRMNGQEVLFEISQRFPNIPVLAMSGIVHDPATIRNLISRGACEFIAKPMSMTALLDHYIIPMLQPLAL